MNFRMKSKHWIAKNLTIDNYNPELWVRPGCQAWKLRVAVNKLYKAGRTKEYQIAKANLFDSLKKDKRKNGSTVLTLELRHGDMVVMHGEEIQKIHEVSVSFHKVLPELTPFSMMFSRRGSCDMD